LIAWSTGRYEPSLHCDCCRVYHKDRRKWVLADIGQERTGPFAAYCLAFCAGDDSALIGGDDLIPLAQTPLRAPIVDPPNLFVRELAVSRPTPSEAREILGLAQL